MSDDSQSRTDKIRFWLRNNRFVAVLISIGTIVTAISAFTNAVNNLANYFEEDSRLGINGEWTAEVNYDWADAKYTETFVFDGDTNQLHGTATFLKRKQLIANGELNGNQIQFTTSSNEFSGDWNNTKATIHRYFGKIENDRIDFVLQTEGGFSNHTPIEFSATKIPDSANPNDTENKR